jgi:type IV pilus assembly protein PilA
MKQRMQKGFTLIELMIVVAIIGILAAVAVPQYQDYTVRSQVSEGLTMAGEFKTAISDFVADRGRFPGALGSLTSLSSVATNYSGSYVTQIDIGTNPGVIQITYGGAKANQALNGLTLGIAGGTNAAGQIVWVCGTAVEPANLTGTPAAFAAADTNVPNRFLPSACRA